MIIACPRCAASYAVEAEAFGPHLRIVECSACGARWRQPPPGGTAGTTGGGTGESPATSSVTAVVDDSSTQAEPDAEDGPESLAPADATTEDSPWPFDCSGDEEDDPSQRPVDTAPAGNPVSDAAPAGPSGQSAGDAATDAAPQEEPPAGNDAVRPGVRKPAVSAASTRMQKLRAARKKLLVGAVAGAATLCALAALAIAFREPLVTIMPRAAGVYGTVGLAPDPVGDGLEIREVASTRERQGTEDVLLIRGVVANVAENIQPLPPLRVSLWNASDQEVQSVTVSHGSGRLEPGESISFEARILEPPPEARILRVGFAQP
jgi:predicted Zn finger-like uncharacterized protein